MTTRAPGTPLRVAVALASLGLLTACSADADTAAEPMAEETVEETTEPEATEPAEEESEAPAEEPTEEAAAPADGPATVLLGTVGTAEDPEAFEIALTDEAGAPVTTLPAGTYEIRVTDHATMHNFRLVGGDVNEDTSVSAVEEAVFTVTLAAGEYEYLCDPHPDSMLGTITVT